MSTAPQARRRGGWVYLDEQSAAIIRTEDTFNVFASPIRLEAEPAVVVDVAADADPLFSSVPVTSMRWPTWFFSSLELPSRIYEPPRAAGLDAVVPAVPVVPAVVLPAVPAVVSAPGAALAISTKLPEPVVVEVPAVVVELADESCRHPLTVILSLSVVLLAVVVLGLCAIAPSVVAQMIAAAIDTVRFIYHLYGTNTCKRGTEKRSAYV
jgi:hypothetical protein